MKKTFVAAILWLGAAGAVLAASPRGWEFSASAPQIYQAEVDHKVFHSGKASGCIKSVGPASATNFAVLTQKIRAVNFRGRRWEMRGFIRTQDVDGWAGMWMRIDSRQGETLEFDNMQNRPIHGTTGWTAYSVKLNVPEAADSINFGLLLSGKGEVWLDDVSFHDLGPVAAGAKERQKLRDPDPLLNLGFEE